MPAIVITLMQGLLLLLLYLFIARAVRAVLRDVSVTAPAARSAARPRPEAPARPRGQRGKRTPPGQLVVHRTDRGPQVVPLDGASVVFGRAADATVQLADPYTSDRHARVHREGGEWVVSDLQSTNGTFVNQVKISRPTPLAAGDQLGIGRTVVEVRK